MGILMMIVSMNRDNQGGHPLAPPFQKGSTPLDSPKGEKGDIILRVWQVTQRGKATDRPGS
jgi:hypothetical protein